MVDYENRSYTTITDIKDKKKINHISNLIPEDVESIIDIGCGNGLITNELGKVYKTLGVDINESKLKFVATDKLKSSCDNIDRPNLSFDLVFSSEMLEHLDDQLFKSTLDEFDRLSKKYILITVPNKEPLHKLYVKCSNCGEIYHKNGHLRAFSKENIRDLHPNWEVIEHFEFGRKVRNYHEKLANIKHQLTPPESWIPGYWQTNKGLKYNFCSRCGHKNDIKNQFNLLTYFLDTFNALIMGKTKSHLLALFQKR